MKQRLDPSPWRCRLSLDVPVYWPWATGKKLFATLAVYDVHRITRPSKTWFSSGTPLTT